MATLTAEYHDFITHERFSFKAEVFSILFRLVDTRNHVIGS